MKYLLILLLFTGCYNQRKAAVQHGRAVTAFPEIGALYCAITYPVKERVLAGKDSIVIDTLWADSSTTTIIRDTLRSRDTVWIKTIQQMPGQVINRTILRVDTVIQEDQAKLSLCSIERGKAIGMLEQKTIESDKWRRIAQRRLWIIIGMGAGIALGIFVMIRKKVAKKTGLV